VYGKADNAYSVQLLNTKLKIRSAKEELQIG
jgi:hypothetical protein